MTDDRLSTLWNAMHPLNGTLDWALFLCTFPVLTLLFLRIRARFLLVFLVGNAVLLISSIPNELYPQGPARPPSVGVLIEGMRTLQYGIHLVGTAMCIHWFVKTRKPQQTSGGDSSPRADAGVGSPQK